MGIDTMGNVFGEMIGIGLLEVFCCLLEGGASMGIDPGEEISEEFGHLGINVAQVVAECLIAVTYEGEASIGFTMIDEIGVLVFETQ